MFVLTTSSPSLWKALVCCGSGSHALQALSWGIMRQAPIFHVCLCLRFLQCVPWTWASLNCMSHYMTKQSPDHLLSQPFMVEPLCLPPTSNISCEHQSLDPSDEHFIFSWASFHYTKLHLGGGDVSYVQSVGTFGCIIHLGLKIYSVWDIFSRRKDGDVSCGGKKEDREEMNGLAQGADKPRMCGCPAARGHLRLR